MEDQLIAMPQNANKDGMLMTARPKNGAAAAVINKPMPVKTIMNLVYLSTPNPMPFALKVPVIDQCLVS